MPTPKKMQTSKFQSPLDPQVRQGLQAALRNEAEKLPSPNPDLMIAKAKAAHQDRQHSHQLHRVLLAAASLLVLVALSVIILPDVNKSQEPQLASVETETLQSELERLADFTLGYDERFLDSSLDTQIVRVDESFDLQLAHPLTNSWDLLDFGNLLPFDSDS